MIICETCNRHVFEHETRCPFCTRSLPRVVRAGLLAAGLVALSGCPTSVAVYGGPPEPDAGVDAATDGGADGAAEQPAEDEADA